MRLLRPVIIAASMTATLGATTLAAPQLVSAAPHSATTWSCGAFGAANGGVGHFDAPGAGNTFSWNTDYPLYSGLLLGTVVVLEKTVSTLSLVSVQPGTGWTYVVEKAGTPRIDVQYTNTGGGGDAPANTLRFRTFFSIDTSRERIAENVTACVPAT
jgi:hypothetical protein